MRQNAVVPFGKYRGQPVEQLVADPEYCEWLMGQSWFVEKYQAIHTVIINNFGEPSETPEHNRLQLRFLDETFLRQCTQHLVSHDPHTATGKDAWPLQCSSARFEINGWDVAWQLQTWDRAWTLDRYGRINGPAQWINPGASEDSHLLHVIPGRCCHKGNGFFDILTALKDGDSCCP